jgi:hypothetical protein
MQFFRLRDDESRNWRNHLIVQLGKEEFNALKTRFDTQVPKLTCQAIIRNGNPYVVFEYGGSICLSEAFGSGETLGEKLVAGDIVTIILTDKQPNQLFSSSGEGLALNFGLDQVIIYPFTYTKEMEQIYDFYRHSTHLKENKTDLTSKTKSKRLSFR